MTSIINSYREVFTERFSLLKLICFVIPTYYAFLLFEQGTKGLYLFHLVTCLTLFFLIGFLIKITSNIINERIVIMPALNPLKIALSSVKGLIGVGPLSLATILLSSYLCPLVNINIHVDIALKIIIWLITASIILTSFLLFCERENIIDAYRVVLLVKNAGDVIVAIIAFLLQLTLINLITYGLIGYILSLLFGFGKFFDLFIVFAVIFNLAATANYFGHAYCEGLGYRSNYD